MDITYVRATPALKRRMQEQWEPNESDYIHFDGDHCNIMALAGKRPIALIVAKKRLLSEPLYALQEAYIDVIEVHPDYQRHGIGTALVAQIVAWARENQLDQVRARSNEDRVEALHLWAKLGFAFSRVDYQKDGKARYGFYAAKRL